MPSVGLSFFAEINSYWHVQVQQAVLAGKVVVGRCCSTAEVTVLQWVLHDVLHDSAWLQQ